MKTVSFSVVLKYLELRGWVLQRTWPTPYRRFLRGRDEWPIVFKVQNRSVLKSDFERIKPFAT